MIKVLNEKQNAYKARMCRLFADTELVKTILSYTPAISKFFECVKFLSTLKTKEHIILMDSNKTLLKYCVLLFEVRQLLINRFKIFNNVHIVGFKVEISQPKSCYK